MKAEPYIRAHLWDAKQAGLRVFRMRQLTEVSVCGCIALFIAGAYAVLRCDYELYVIWQYAWVSWLYSSRACYAAPLYEHGGQRGVILVEGWKDYAENRTTVSEHAQRELTLVRENVKEPDNFKTSEPERARGKLGKGRNIEVMPEAKPNPKNIQEDQIAGLPTESVNQQQQTVASRGFLLRRRRSFAGCDPGISVGMCGIMVCNRTV